MKIPRLVVFDLDGTLAESKQRMSAETTDLFTQLLQKIPVAVMSGGGWKQFEKQFLPALPDTARFDRLYLFPTSAASCMVYREGAWHPQYDHSFGTEAKQRIMLAINEALDEVGFEQPPQLWGEQVEDRGAEITFSALGQEAPLEAKQGYDPTGAKRRPLTEALKQKLPDLNINMNATTSIDITPHGIDKAYGIARLAELTRVPVADMLYVGDALEEGGNDAVVTKTGIATHAVFGPEETEAVIAKLLALL